jgi:hypothetical protein
MPRSNFNSILQDFGEPNEKLHQTGRSDRLLRDRPDGGERPHLRSSFSVHVRFLKTLTLTGSVVEVRWTNPHVTLLVNGKANEADENADWLLEMSSPSNLIRVSNWTRTTVKIGDHVKVQMAPLRDSGARGGSLKTLTLIDTGESFTPNIRDREEPGLQ